LELTDDQRRRFHRDGYLVIEGLLRAQDVSRLRADIAHYHTTLGVRVPRGVLVSWEPGSIDGRPPKIQQILNAEKVSTAVDQLLRSDRVLGPVRSLVGPDVALFESKLLMKSSAGGGPVPWHQDYAYWQTVTAWPTHINCMIYIDDADANNGCLQVLPGSHRWGLSRHRHRSGGSVFDRELPGPTSDDVPVLLPGRAGTAILFGPLLMHASAPNTSPRERRSATLVYTLAEKGPPESTILSTRPAAADPHDAFGLHRVKAFTGEGPHGGQCARSYRERELWKLAADHVTDSLSAWADVSVSMSEEDSLAWWVAHKPPRVPFLRLDTCPTVASNRDDLHVIGGPIALASETAVVRETLRRRLAMLKLDGRYYFPTRQTLDALRPWIGPGTVLVIDRFHGEAGWSSEAALALAEAVDAWAMHLELLGRADNALAMRVVSIGEAASIDCAPTEWAPTTTGIRFEHAPVDSGEPASCPRRGASVRALAQRARRVVGRSLQRFGLSPGLDARRMTVPAPVDTVLSVPLSAIPRVVGDGPPGTRCPTHARRREVWRYAASLVDDASLCWCECGVGEGESLDWFALAKPRGNVLFGFDSFEGIPEPWLRYGPGHWKAPVYAPNRPDVVIVRGRFEDTLGGAAASGRLGRRIGLLHVDCDLYSSTRVIFEAWRELIAAGTVIVFDEFYGYDGWQQHEAKAFEEFVIAAGLAVECLARSDFQLAVRVVGVAAGPRLTVRAPAWRPSLAGLSLEMPYGGAAISG
jgi:ectoine hydroxylase-related dioxygenase (phytanoyl-CoA dioxygenase family)